MNSIQKEATFQTEREFYFILYVIVLLLNTVSSCVAKVELALAITLPQPLGVES